MRAVASVENASASFSLFFVDACAYVSRRVRVTFLSLSLFLYSLFFLTFTLHVHFECCVQRLTCLSIFCARLGEWRPFFHALQTANAILQNLY